MAGCAGQRGGEYYLMVSEEDKERMQRACAVKSAAVHAIADTAATKAVLEWLQRAQVPFNRPHPNQLKIGNLSFYLSSGTMNFDGRKREAESGLLGLKTVLELALDTKLPPIS